MADGKGRVRIGLREVRALEPGSTTYDSEVMGFAARRQKGPAVTYVLRYRTKDGRQRWAVIGKHGSPWTPDAARAEARRLLVQIEGGADPSGAKAERRKAVTVRELCADYMEAARDGTLLTRKGAAKRASTLDVDEGRIARHILPLLGAMPVSGVTRKDVTKFLNDVAGGRTAGEFKTQARGLARVTGGRTAATRAVGLLGSIFSYALERGLVDASPVVGVRRFADRRKERRLTDAEYEMLGKGFALAAAAPEFVRKDRPRGTKGEGAFHKDALAAIRLLCVTGWRTAEVTKLTWGEVDTRRRVAVLADTKAGRSVRPLSRAACDILAAQGRGTDTAELVFRAARGDGAMNIKPYFRRLAKLAGLPKDISPHVLRHSLASAAGDLGLAESTVAAMLGHRTRSVTAGYTHLADATLLAAADTAARHVLELLAGGAPAEPSTVVPFRTAS